MKSVFTLQRTLRSVPHAYFASYREAQTYNEKYLDGKFIVKEQIITSIWAKSLPIPVTDD
jgi:hypothetical protein